MTPKEIAQKFNEAFGLDFHDYYDKKAWKEEREIRLDFFKFADWIEEHYGHRPMRDILIENYGKDIQEFIIKIT